jgi:hypothetical protein
VGSVKTNGVDAAVTLHFGRQFTLYNATSFNSSIWQRLFDRDGRGHRHQHRRLPRW